MFGRLIASIIAVVVYGWAMMVYTPQATLITGQAAGRQFQNSDAAYLSAVYTMNFFSAVGGLLTIAILAVLLLIWLTPIRKALGLVEAEIKKSSAPLIALCALAGLALVGVSDAKAFFETTDRTEIHSILPNESAFWIPDVGDNKGSQAKMDSEAYLNENKIAAKRFQIPHQKLTGSAGNSMLSGWDYFVPAGRLIIVDRTPFSREWVDDENRGTSVKKEGFPCQSKEGLNVTAGVSIGTSVEEKNAAKFLYRFGVKNPVGPDGKPAQIKGTKESIAQDGQIIFASVYYGRSLREVMDDVGRKKVQTLICNQIGKRTFDKANEDMVVLMEEVEKQTKAYFDSVGITLDFIGWGDTFEFDKPVQEAINRAYAAKQERAIAEMLQPYAETIKLLADAQATRKFGDATDGKLPTTFVGPAPTAAGPLLSLPSVPRTAPATAPAR